MNKDMVEKWLELLPTIPQARCQLVMGFGMCCLGVAYETLVREGKRKWDHFEYDFDGSVCVSKPSDVFLRGEEAEIFGLDKTKTVTRVRSDDTESTLFPMTVTTEIELQRYLSTYNDAGFSQEFIRRIIRMELGL